MTDLVSGEGIKAQGQNEYIHTKVDEFLLWQTFLAGRRNQKQLNEHRLGLADCADHLPHFVHERLEGRDRGI